MRGGTLPEASIQVAGNQSGGWAEYSCLKGYQVSSSKNSKIKTFCNDDGQWEPDISSFSCVPIACPFPVVNKGVEKAEKENPNHPYFHGELLTLTCPFGKWFPDFPANGMRYMDFI